ncbi:hypothetical protein Fcan01_28346 [Folsomia candida]|uniref:Uncharacterized protein n=1 Tax=Folsomia candida TaxID=158441 RepID=A0A226CWH9_FOLCA|nr:hypothetical protein Fcan01_28346 [Folsomia candida]
MERRLIFRLVLGSWCLMSVILTNCYNGVMITELNAPHEAWKPTLFDDLVCERMPVHHEYESCKGIVFYFSNYKNLTPLPVDAKELQKYGFNGTDKIQLGWYTGAMLQLINNSITRKTGTRLKHMYIKELINPFAQKGCFHFLSLPNGYVSGFPDLPEFLRHLFNGLTDRKWFRKGSCKNTKAPIGLQLLNLLHPMHTHHLNGFQYSNPNQTLLQLRYNLERELLQCGKSVYISKPQIVKAELDFLNKYYPSKRFYKGKETLNETFHSWYLDQRGKSKVPRKFRAVIESGIYGRLQLEEIHQKYLSRKPLIRLEPYVVYGRLDGALSTLSILCGGTVILASLVALVEIRSNVFSTVVKSFNSAVN